MKKNIVFFIAVQDYKTLAKLTSVILTEVKELLLLIGIKLKPKDCLPKIHLIIKQEKPDILVIDSDIISKTKVSKAKKPIRIVLINEKDLILRKPLTREKIKKVFNKVLKNPS